MVLNSQNWSKLVPKGSEQSKLNKESIQGERKWVYFMKKWAFDPKNRVTEMAIFSRKTSIYFFTGSDKSNKESNQRKKVGVTHEKMGI